MVITVDYPMLKKLREDIEYSDNIKKQFWQEFVTWYFKPMESDSSSLFVQRKNDLDKNFEKIVNQFLKHKGVDNAKLGRV